MGIGSKCVSEDFQELSFSNFQAFLRRGCISFNPFLSNLDNSPHLTVFYSRFLLDAFTYGICCWARLSIGPVCNPDTPAIIDKDPIVVGHDSCEYQFTIPPHMSHKVA